MVKKIIEMWFPQPSGFGPVRVWFDPEALAGAGEVTVTDNSDPVGDPTTNRLANTGEYPSPISPQYSSTGNKFTLSRQSGTPYATHATAATVCDIQNTPLTAEVIPARVGSDGQITVTAVGTNGPKEFSKDGGATWQASPTFSRLAPGDYLIIAADAARFCTVQETFTVPNEVPVVNDLQITNIQIINESAADANDGQIIVTAQGSNTPLSYTIVHPSGAIEFHDVGTANINEFTGLPPGVYTVRAGDSDNNAVEQRNVVVLEFSEEEPLGPLEPTRLTEIKRIHVREVACYSPFVLQWKTYLNSIEHWVFPNSQIYNLDADQEGEFRAAYSSIKGKLGDRDILNHHAGESITLGDDGLSDDHVSGLSTILYSEEIYEMRKVKGEWKRHRQMYPVPGSIKVKDTDGNTHSIELTLEAPKLWL